jgi:hypothetical protein
MFFFMGISFFSLIVYTGYSGTIKGGKEEKG